MNKPAYILSSLMLCFIHAGAALAVEVTIDTAGYAGEWTVNYGDPHRGPAVVKLGEPDRVVGAHVISLSGAELMFNVDEKTGKVVVQQPEAAEGGRYTLTFNTTKIQIDPGHFRGDWRISGRASRDYRGVQTLLLVKGLSFYGLELGATGAFSFDIAGNGEVTVRNPLAGSGGKNSLTVKNTERFLD
ncbi:MAG: hypothetical protein WD397_13195 [Wenzhouxiangellaceae bacterium]